MFKRTGLTVKLVIMYFILGTAWILFSDRLVEKFTLNMDTLMLLDTLKGWFFVSVTSLLLFILVRREVNARSYLNEQLERTKEQFLLTSEAVDSATYVWDIETGRIDWTRSLTETFGYSVDEFTSEGSWWMERVHDEDRQRVHYSIIKSITHGQGFAEEYRFLHNDGIYLHVCDKAVIVRNKLGKAIRLIGAMRNITEQRRNEQQIEQNTYYDVLTGLPNRYSFRGQAEQAIANAHNKRNKIAILLMDIDRFKKVIDTFGHTAGDRLLLQISARLKGCTGPNDSLFRMNGDEFAILLTDLIQVGEAANIANNLLEAFSTPFNVQDNELFLTASIGIGVYPYDGVELDAFMHCAESALSRVKRDGRNHYQFYTPDMSEMAGERLSLESSLRKAIGQKEFVVHYQPKVDLETGEIIGMEALLRWYHSKLGFISPAKFIPIAEDAGLIGSIDEWVLYAACAQNKAWQEAGLPPMRVSVNLSAWQFRNARLVDTVSRVLSETGLDGKWLELEITETAIIEQVDQGIHLLHQLKSLGIHISLDDFGTGYSSLSHLRQFPIDTIKLDKSFIDDIPSNTNDAMIAKALISLAHVLNIKVIAEGVERAEQLEYLQENECDQMQGYLFSRPLPKEQFENLLRESRIYEPAGTGR